MGALRTESGGPVPTARADYSLRSISDLEHGDHVCALYQGEAEHRAMLTVYLRQGLEQKQKVLYIVDTNTADTILGYLNDDGVEVERYLASGQLAVLSVREAYMRDGVFSPDRMIALLQEETSRALVQGYSALRVTGEMSWALRGFPGSRRLIEYEAKLNGFAPHNKCVLLCQYDRRRFSPRVLLDVLCTHPVAVVGSGAYTNFYYMPPAEFWGRMWPRPDSPTG